MTWRTASFVVWAGLAALLVACQVAALVSKGRLPRIGALVQVAMAPPAGRALVVLGWMWLGWHAFAR